MGEIVEKSVMHFDGEVFAGEHPKEGWWKAASSSAVVHQDSAEESRAAALRDAAAAASRTVIRGPGVTFALNSFAPDYQLQLAIRNRDAELGEDLVSDDEVSRDRMIQNMRLDTREGLASENVSHFDETKDYDADAARARMIARLNADSRDSNAGTNKANIAERIGELGLQRPAPLRGAIARELRKG